LANKKEIGRALAEAFGRSSRIGARLIQARALRLCGSAPTSHFAATKGPCFYWDSKLDERHLHAAHPSNRDRLSNDRFLSNGRDETAQPHTVGVHPKRRRAREARCCDGGGVPI
jgi:hypothetical protein